MFLFLFIFIMQANVIFYFYDFFLINNYFLFAHHKQFYKKRMKPWHVALNIFLPFLAIVLYFPTGFYSISSVTSSIIQGDYGRKSV